MLQSENMASEEKLKAEMKTKCDELTRQVHPYIISHFSLSLSCLSKYIPLVTT